VPIQELVQPRQHARSIPCDLPHTRRAHLVIGSRP
jgi:hypothetical protein